MHARLAHVRLDRTHRILEPTLRILSITTEPLEIPLVDPFVIASARVDVTPSVLVRVEVEGRPLRQLLLDVLLLN